MTTPSDRERQFRVGSRRMILAGTALAGSVAVIAAVGAITLRTDSTSHASLKASEMDRIRRKAR